MLFSFLDIILFYQWFTGLEFISCRWLSFASLGQNAGIVLIMRIKGQYAATFQTWVRGCGDVVWLELF